MEDMNEKLNAILSNPQMMQQIMKLAQAMNTSSEEQAASPQNQQANQPPAINGNMLDRLASLAQSSSIDREQQSLLKALNPYLSHEKLRKLERAMQAARMAGVASSFLNAGGLGYLTGR